MIINDDSKVKFFTTDKLSEEEIKKLNIPSGYEYVSNSITKIDNIFYYYKKVSCRQMINELIGSYLSKMINLGAVDYQIGMNNGDIYALSEIFYESNYFYTNCFDYFGATSDLLLDSLQTTFSFIYVNEVELLEVVRNHPAYLSLLKLIAVDLKMGQYDRHNLNIMLKINSDNMVYLTHVYDFERSYYDDKIFMVYDNPFVTIRKNGYSLKKFIEKFPEFKEYIELFSNVWMDDMLDEIEVANGIKVSDKERCYYRKKDHIYNKVLRKI